MRINPTNKPRNLLRSNMISAAFLCFFLVISLVRSESPFSASMGNPRNHPSGLLRRHKIKMQPKELVDECLDCQPFPTPADLDVHRLTKLIGGALDGNLVSVSKPTNFTSSTQLTLHTKTEALRELVMKSTRDMEINGGNLSTDQQTFLVNWLKDFSSCTLRQVWRNMGPFSWPRYIKLEVAHEKTHEYGYKTNKESYSKDTLPADMGKHHAQAKKRAFCERKRCSLVPTMQCLPSSRRFFPVLRWFCLRSTSARLQLYPQNVRQNVVTRKGFMCRWIRYNQPITTGCSCGCQS